MDKNNVSKEDKKLFNELFWASFPLECSYNYERQQALGFAIAMWPAIKRFYKTKEEQAKALVRHMAIFNTTPHVVTFITGVAAAMEKNAASDPKFDLESINSVKVGLMGPFAGIGDSMFWGTIRIISLGLALPLAQQGLAFAPILFLLVFNLIHILVRYFGGIWGYKFGTDILSKASESGLVQKVSKAATIVGLMVVGAMVYSMVGLSSSLQIGFGEKAFKIQEFLDQILPGLLPLLYTLLMFRFLKKGKSATFLLLFTIIVGLVLTLTHII
ncbi:MAG: PTS system mannose/fructose/sorbose family transporter subunit IID [Anaerolineaceae bacterium]|nr:PTS system mannose/fructose/sorbose family transporter subunit IID [Anaerolineaceae bacterium]